jgi:glycosyltransferase involved in cell wall biosynthesis
MRRMLLLSRYGRLGASSRIRTQQYIPHLQSEGFNITVAPLFRDEYLTGLYRLGRVKWSVVMSDYFRRALLLLRVRRFDLLWIEKELFPNLPSWTEQALAASRIPYIVDYDDAVFHRYDLSTNALKRLLTRKIDTVMRNAALVVCGNTYLAERARAAQATRVEIIPSVVDLRRYTLSERPKRNVIVIGWIGSPTTAAYLDVITPALRTLSKEYAVKLRIVGATFSAPGLDIECRPWSEQTEVKEIQDFDIGVMPLFDSPWERGKCGYKLIQYMACGVPTVASGIGMNRDIVAHGTNGFLAMSPAEWTTAIRALCASSDLRQDLGRQGRLTVEASYSLQRTSARLTHLFKDVMSLYASGPHH